MFSNPKANASNSDSGNKTIKTRLIPRKTYLCGFLRGKYWGEKLFDPAGREHDALYEFHIYEAEVHIMPAEECTCITSVKTNCSGLHTEAEGEFHFQDSNFFSKERLPQLLPVILKQDGSEYSTNIHGIQLANISFISQLHQTNGKDVNGTIEANITGYLLDFIEEEYTDEDYIEEVAAPKITSNINARHTGYGNSNFRESNYYKSSRRYSHYKYRNGADEGCISSMLGIIVIVTWTVFIISILPRLAIILPFILVPLLFRFIPSVIWKWSVNIFSIVIGATFLAMLIGIFSGHPVHHPTPVTEETTPIEQHDETYVNDSMIIHNLRWKNYEGHEFSGRIWILRQALSAASRFKTSLQITNDARQSYDEMVYRLWERDKAHLKGIYQLFDSIGTAQHLQNEKFAELIVSFVQHIPYAVVLPEDCNPSLYADQFIRNYLTSPNANCDGNEKFGINTPVEFMANLKGDCDTRTLLLYTILSHYKYDVALLSSEYYNHSLIGIHLPYNGMALDQGSKRYVLWETTAKNMKPGILPYEISNLNYWRISLKSQ